MTPFFQPQPSSVLVQPSPMAPDTLDALPEEEEEHEALTARERAPKKARSKEARRKLGKRIGEAVRRGKEQRGGLSERTRLNERLCRNENVAPPKLPWPSAQHFHVPMLGPRLAQRKANIVATITTQDPLFRLSGLRSLASNDRIERSLQFALDAVGFKETLDEALQVAMETNMPIWRVTFQYHPDGFGDASHTGPFAGLVFDVIHPDYFICYPATRGGIRMSRVCGHVFDERKAVVKHKQKIGEYFDDVELKSSDDLSTLHLDRLAGTDKKALEPVPDEESDENIAIYDLIWRDDLEGDGVERLYTVHFRESSDDILSIDPYEDPYHNYIAMPVKKEWGRFFAEGSPAQDGQGMQLLLNALVNLFVWGNQMRSRPPVLTESWTLDESMVGFEPGEMRPVRQVGKAMPVPTSFDAQGFDYLIQLIRTAADSATKTSDAITGAPASSREATATEQNIKYQGFQIGASDDVTAITPALRKLMMVSLHLLAKNFVDWKNTYGDAIPAQTPDELRQPVAIELAGKSPADSPQLQSEQAQMLLQLASMFPQAGIPLGELIESIVTATSLPNKEDIVRQIQQTTGMELPIQLEQLLGAVGGVDGTEQGLNPEALGALLALGGMAGGGVGPAGLSGIDPETAGLYQSDQRLGGDALPSG